MNIIEATFKNKRINVKKLCDYGFKPSGKEYTYRTPLLGGEMRAEVNCSEDGQVTAKVFDSDGDGEYTLHLVDGATGEFVGKVRKEYCELLSDIAAKCFDDVTFRFSQTALVTEYAKSVYGDELEFLWKDDFDDAVLRRKDNGKWYAVIMRVHGDKFGRGNESDEVIDLRADPDELDKIADGEKYFRGYHMNKKYWLTIVLDGAVPTEEICARLDESYKKVGKKTK